MKIPISENKGQNQWTDQGVTLVIVTYNSSSTIAKCLESTNRTLRKNDEVIVVDNASHDRTVQIVQSFIAGRKNHRLISNTCNKGYAAAANQGARAGGKPYIVFLNPDTIVGPQWLERLIFHLGPREIAAVGPVSNYVAGLQQAAFHLPKDFQAYSDIHALEHSLRQCNFQKSIPANLLIGFCLMVKRDVFNLIGAMDDHLFLGNDDLDLSWRLREAGYGLVIATDTFVFHQGQASFATSPRMLTDRLVQESTDYLFYKLVRYYGVQGVPDSQTLWDMDWFVPKCKFGDNHALVSIIILTFNQVEYTRQCIQSLFDRTGSPFELIIVDNGSTDDTLEYLSSLDRSGTACIRLHLIINEENAGFARGCNQAMAAARGDSLLLLNNDVVVTPDWLTRLTRVLSLRDTIGLVGPVTNYAPGPQRIAAPRYDENGLDGLNQYAGQRSRRLEGQTCAHWRLSGFCLLIKRAVIEKIGGLDTRFGIGNFEDDDFCLRARLAGFESLIAKDCFVHHFGSKTFNGNHINHRDHMQHNWTLFKQKWHIASETPLGPDYRVSLPASGFNRSAHYIAIEEKKPGHGAHVQKASTPAAVSQAVAKDDDIPGGYNMSILDQVCSIVQEHISRENKPAAVWILNQLIASAPDHAGAHHELGLLQYESGDLDKAQTHLQRSVALNPENPAYAKDLGDFYYVALKDTVKAVPLYDKAAALSPGDHQILLTAGHLHLSLQHFEQARQYYLRVLEQDPSNEQVRAFLEKIASRTRPDQVHVSAKDLWGQAQDWIQAGDRDQAVAALDKLLSADPQHALAHNDRGVLAFENGDKDGALRHYLQAVTLEPDNKIFLKNLADFYLVEKGDARAAMEKYVQVLKQDPSDIETIFSCGQACMLLKRNEDAHDFFQRVLEIEPWNKDARRLIDQMEALNAGDSFSKDRATLFEQAQKKAADGDIQGALAHLEQILRQDPQNAQTYNDLGVLYYENGEKEKALFCYEQAVLLNPQDTNFQKNLADFYLAEQGRLEDAMKIYVQVLKSNPRDVDSLLASGLVCASLGETSDALTFYRRVLEIEPWNESAHQSIRQIDGKSNQANGVGAGDDQPMQRYAGNRR